MSAFRETTVASQMTARYEKRRSKWRCRHILLAQIFLDFIQSRYTRHQDYTQSKDIVIYLCFF